MTASNFRYRINGGSWVETSQELPYTITGITTYDTVEVEPIGGISINDGYPVIIGNIQDIVYSKTTGTHTVATASAFMSSRLTYSLVTSPAGTTIDSSSGVVSITTNISNEYTLQPIIVRATNTRGYVDLQFLVSVLELYPAAFQSTLTDGWSVSYANPPTFQPYTAPEAVTVYRQGFANDGTATTWPDKLILTQRVRLPYPDQATLDSTRVSLSDYIYTGDTIYGGAVNNSTETSPKPVANWTMLDRLTVGNTVSLEIIAGHRNARGREQVACVEFTVSDGTTTVTQKVNTSMVSPSTTDRNAVIVYRADIDISTLANPATLTCNAKVYPWFGTSGSVLNSADSAVAREFSPRYFRRDTARAAAPYLIYVAVSGGNDTTGAVNTDPTTAKNSPCATVSGAIARAQTVLGAVDGVEIRLMAGTHVMSITYATAKTQTHSAFTITRDPIETKSSVTLNYGSNTFRMRLGSAGGWVLMKGITMVRTGVTQPSGEAASTLNFYMQDIDFNNGGQGSQLFGATCNGKLDGVNFTTSIGGSVLGAGARENQMLRGLNGTIAGVEGWLVIGCYIVNMTGPMAYGSRTASGSIVMSNWFNGVLDTSTGFVTLGGTADVSGAIFSQNICEFLSNNLASTAMRLSADGATGNTTHVIFHHNIVTGYFSAGRSNMCYNEGTVARTNKLMSLKGNIYSQLNTKHDVFKQDGTRVQSWGYLYGAGCEGEMSLYIDATLGGIGSDFAQEFPGFNGSLGTSSTVPQDIKWVNYAGPTAGAAGAGGGNYHIASNSPAKSRLYNSVLRFDIEGNTRPATYSSAGCYE